MKSFVTIPMKQFEIINAVMLDIRDAFEEKFYRVAEDKFDELQAMLETYLEKEGN